MRGTELSPCPACGYDSGQAILFRALPQHFLNLGLSEGGMMLPALGA